MEKPRKPVWQITSLAARRYAERVEVSVDTRDAKHRLLEALSGATLLPELSILGDEQWSLSSGAVVVGKRVGRLTVAVTVLSAGQRETVAEVVDAARRISEEKDPEPARSPQPVKVKVSKSPNVMSADSLASISTLRAEKNRALKEVERLEAELRGRVNELESKERHLARITAHSVSEGINAKVYRLALRSALRVAELSDAPQVISEVEKIDRFLVSEEFLYPERFTRAERIARRTVEQDAFEQVAE